MTQQCHRGRKRHKQGLDKPVDADPCLLSSSASTITAITTQWMLESSLFPHSLCCAVLAHVRVQLRWERGSGAEMTKPNGMFSLALMPDWGLTHRGLQNLFFERKIRMIVLLKIQKKDLSCQNHRCFKYVHRQSREMFVCSCLTTYHWQTSCIFKVLLEMINAGPSALPPLIPASHQ